MTQDIGRDPSGQALSASPTEPLRVSSASGDDPSRVPLCVNCKHVWCEQNSTFCVRAKSDRRSPVDGRHDDLVWRACKTERRREWHLFTPPNCGPEARFFEMRERPTLYCSFCGKSQHEVRKLIAGPTVFICDECVELCNQIIDEATVVESVHTPGIVS